MVKYCILAVCFFLLIPVGGKAYSVLTHEAIVDASWDISIEPLLKKKYPNATDDQLKDARAYVYGGAIMPDMGYYPFGSKFFTNLLHYVRSGDFVMAMLDTAQDLNEYAFALGALCHYNADKFGHSIAVNRAAPLIYPDIKARYGNVVTYAEDKISHIRTEFGFDVVQTARGNYVPTAYHNFIGFQISRPVLERAFLKTYGLDITDVFSNLPLAISTFRFSVKNLFPEMTKAAWASKKSDIIKNNPTATRRSYIYRVKQSAYNKEFGRQRTRPGFFAGILAVIIKIAPKIGPLKALKFKPPGTDAEKLFSQSFDSVVVNYSNDIHNTNTNSLALANIDFDTGNRTAIGEYSLTDETYEELVVKLTEKNFTFMNAALKKNILAFYHASSTPPDTKQDPQDQQKLKDALERLEQVQVQ